MTKKLKKSLATLLAMSMILSMASVSAFANEPENDETENQIVVCAELEGCTEERHAEGCPLYEVPEEPEAGEPVEGSEQDPVENENQSDGEETDGEPVADEEPVVDEDIAPIAKDGEESDTDMWSASEIVISNVASLKEFAAKVNSGTTFQGKTVTLGADLDLANEEWTPIGNEGNPFQGTFDGGNKTIRNLTVTGAESFVGLFGRTTTPAVVKDLTVNNAAVSGQKCVAALVGSAYTGSVTNCHVTGDIRITGNYDVGGLTGYGYAKLENCSVVGENGSSVTGVYQEANLEGDNVGGLIGYFAEGSSAMTNCHAENLAVTGTRKVGGLIGSTHADRSLVDCSAKDVTVGTNATAEYAAENTKTMGIGGLIGLFNGSSGGRLENCSVENVTLSNPGNVIAKMGYVSGGGRTSEEFSAPEMTFVNVTISGTNTGTNANIHSPALSGNGIMTENTVAQVGDNYYESIQAAIDACPDNGTVKVLADTDESITLPLRSITLTSEGETKPVLTGKVSFAGGAMPEGTQMTIENLAFENTYIHLVAWSQTTNLDKMGGLTIRNNTFAGTPDEAGSIYAIHINNGDMAVNNLTITGNVFTNCGTGSGGCVFTTACGDLVVTGNEFRNSTMNALTLIGKDSTGNKTASAVISGNVFDGWAAQPENRTDGRAMRLSYFDCDVDLTQNSFVSTNPPEEYIKLTDGKKADVDKCYWGGEAPSIDKLLGVSPVLSYYTDAEMTHLVVSTSAVAEAGGNYFTTLQAAIDAAEDGETVTLLKDTVENVKVSNQIILNLNGKTLTNADKGSIGNEAMTIWVAVSGDLEVIGSGTVQITKAAGAAVFNQGTVTLSGGTYERPEGTQGYVLFNSVGAEMTLNEGITASSADPKSSLAAFDAGKNGPRSTVTINGGTYTSINTTLKNDANTDLVINGGTFNTSTHYALVNYDKATINGGTFNGSLWNSTGVAGVGELTIKNGEFNPTVGTGKDLIINGSAGTVSISGGTFSNEVSAEYCAEGFLPIANANGTYGVTDEPLAITPNRTSQSGAGAVTLTVTPAGLTADVEVTCGIESVTLTDNGDGTWTTSRLPNTTATYTFTVKAGETEATCTVSVSRYVAPSVPDTDDEDLGDDDTPLTDRPWLFTDVKEGDYFYDAVKRLFDKDIVGGTTETTYEPYADATRGMVAVILYGMAGNPDVTGLEMPFSDVRESDYYYNAVLWAYENKVIGGYPDGTFQGEKTISRAELAAVLHQYGVEKLGLADTKGDLSVFIDEAEVENWSREHLEWAVGMEIMHGDNAKKLMPLDLSIRADMTIMLNNLELLVSDEE